MRFVDPHGYRFDNEAYERLSGLVQIKPKLLTYRGENSFQSLEIPVPGRNPARRRLLFHLGFGSRDAPQIPKRVNWSVLE